MKFSRNIKSILWSHVAIHYDVIKWKHLPRYWPFVRGIHRLAVNSPHKGQWRGALMFCLICAWINAWINNLEAGDLRRRRAHYDVIKCLPKPLVVTVQPINACCYSAAPKSLLSVTTHSMNNVHVFVLCCFVWALFPVLSVFLLFWGICLVFYIFTGVFPDSQS